MDRTQKNKIEALYRRIQKLKLQNDFLFSYILSTNKRNWLPEDDTNLIYLFGKGIEINILKSIFKRDEKSIEDRLDYLLLNFVTDDM